MQERRSRLRSGLRARGWDAIWVTTAANRRYLTGFTGSAGWFLQPARGRGTLITDGRYEIQAREEARAVKITVSHEDGLRELAGLLQRLHVRILAFEDESVSVALWRRLKRLLPGLQGAGAERLVETARAVKDAGEISCLKKAVQISHTAFERVVRRIRPGISERGLAFELEKALYTAGSEGLSFPIIAASGPNSALPHAAPTDRRLRAGDLLVLDFGCRYRGYHSDLTRTLAVARMSEKQRKVYNIVKKAQNLSQKMIVSGQLFSKSAQKAKEIFRSEGWEKYFVHSLGHGIGLEVHEDPRISSTAKGRFLAGMVVTCEPGLYFPGWGGIRIEDDILVSEKSSQLLSCSAAELRVAGRRG